MNEREEFENWADSRGLNIRESTVDSYEYQSQQTELHWFSWQAATEATEAKYQARIKELEEALRYHQEQTRPIQRAIEALSTTTPDQALQRAILEARLNELEISPASIHSLSRFKELRAQLAALGE